MAAAAAQRAIFPLAAPPEGCGPADTSSSTIRIGSPGATARIQPLVVPQGPTSLQGHVSGTTVTLNWSAPASGDAPMSYVIEAGSSSGRADLVIADTGSTATSQVVTSVPPGTYYVRVRARNASGTSGPSNEALVSVAGACPSAPGAPGGLTFSVNGGAVTLAWQPPSASCAPTWYVIEAGSAPGLTNLAMFSTGSTAPGYAASGIAAGTYYLRVRAENSAGASGTSNEIQVVVGGCAVVAAGPPGLDGLLYGESDPRNGNHPVTLIWTAVGAGSPSSYIIEVGSVSGAKDIVNMDTGSMAASLTAIASPGTYYARVRARNACGASPPSPEAIVVVTAPASCVGRMEPTSQSVTEGATGGIIEVIVAAECAWTATSNAPFLTVTAITASPSGAGSKRVRYSADANTTGRPRTGTLTIGGLTFTVTQQVCSYAVGPPTFLDANGGFIRIPVIAPSACDWHAQSDADFLVTATGAGGRGSDSLIVQVPHNGGTVRGGAIAIGQPFQTASAVVVQDGDAGPSLCVNAITSLPDQTSAQFGREGGGRTVDVNAPATCAWIARATAPWLDVNAEPSPVNPPFGLGNAAFGMTVSPNTEGAARVGGVTAGGYTLPVKQEP
jgi:hypothetical protein